jgi:hypothetical protein
MKAGRGNDLIETQKKKISPNFFSPAPEYLLIGRGIQSAADQLSSEN